MTREEAIQFLDNIKHEEAGRAIGKDGFYVELMGYHVEALNMAIKALEQEPKTGHWIEGKCDQCGGHAPFWSMASTYYESEYCPNCGARMESEDKE